MFSITVQKRSKVVEGLRTIISGFIENIQDLMADQKAKFSREFRQIIA
jgi:hypothetical protein